MGGLSYREVIPLVQPISLRAFIGFIPKGDLRVLIQALETHTSTDILATPSIRVLDNKSASLAMVKIWRLLIVNMKELVHQFLIILRCPLILLNVKMLPYN